jgi:hypothetical protein
MRGIGVEVDSETATGSLIADDLKIEAELRTEAISITGLNLKTVARHSGAKLRAEARFKTEVRLRAEAKLKAGDKLETRAVLRVAAAAPVMGSGTKS